MRSIFSFLLVTILVAVDRSAPHDRGAKNRASGPEIAHVSLSKLDQWADCVEHLTGKPLLVANLQSADFSCPSSQQGLARELEGKAVLVPGEKWDLLIGENSPNSPPLATPPEFWKGVKVTLSIESWKALDGSRRPSPSELDQLSTAALGAMRPSLGVEAPIAKKTADGSPAKAIAEINLELLFDIHSLSEAGPESVIGILREKDGGIRDGRLIYGEFKDGKPIFLWDSPRLTTRMLNLKYRDLDHDGIEEILLMGFRPSRGTLADLVIFAATGEELSRQPGGVEGFTAPIETGGAIKFVPDDQGVDLIEVLDESDESKVDETYALSGTYKNQSVESPAQSGPVEGNAGTRANEEGIRLMKAKNYEAAAAKFTEAFHIDPNDAMFANNVGFAWYRAGKLQEAVLWFQQAISLDPRRAVAYLNLGDAYAKLSKEAPARDAYQKYLDLAPNSKAAPDVKKKLEALSASH